MQKIRNTITNVQALTGIIASVGVLVLLAVMMESKVQLAWQKEQLAAVLTSVEVQRPVPVVLHPADIIAKSAIVYDIVTGDVLYNKNADDQVPLASLTKLVTALVADAELGAQVSVQVSEQALATEGESGLLAGDVWRERDLADFMLTVSSNDAASVFAQARGQEEQFIVKMNILVQRLGLQSLIFFNESGLDKSEQQAGAYGSARDIAYLLAYITFTQPELLEATTFSGFTSVSATGLRYKAINTNKIVGQIPGLIGGKTGFTDLAGGNLAIVFDSGIGHPVAVVVLGSTVNGRFNDVMTLVNEVLK